MASPRSTLQKRVLITGANRGLGLELAKCHLAAGHLVWGTARPDRSDRLEALRPTGTVPMDLGQEETIVAGISDLAEQTDSLDVLINCAGIDARALGGGERERGPFDLDGDTFTAVMRVNATGPMIVTRETLPLLRGSSDALVLNISSQLGSMDFAANAGSDVSYCVSKAALNMLTVKTAAALKADGIAVVALHPGWVSTDMGGPSATLTPEESAKAILGTAEQLTLSDSGRFITWDGRDHSW